MYYIRIAEDFTVSMAMEFNKAVKFITTCTPFGKKLIIFITSPGGNVTALASIFNELERLRATVAGIEIITVAETMAASCGFMLWCMGDKRFVKGQYTELMCHSMQVWQSSTRKTPEVLESKAKQVKVLQTSLYKAITDMNGIPNNLLDLLHRNTHEIVLYGHTMNKGNIHNSVTAESEDDKDGLIADFKTAFCTSDFATVIIDIVPKIQIQEAGVIELSTVPHKNDTAKAKFRVEGKVSLV